MYAKMELKEYVINELPRPDKTILLYLPYEYAYELKKNRQELPDDVENNTEYLKNSEKTYLELSKLYHYDVINCVGNNQIRSVEDINDEVYLVVKEFIEKV